MKSGSGSPALAPTGPIFTQLTTVARGAGPLEPLALRVRLRSRVPLPGLGIRGRGPGAAAPRRMPARAG